jgi:hypothetical protein
LRPEKYLAGVPCTPKGGGQRHVDRSRTMPPARFAYEHIASLAGPKGDAGVRH